MRYGINKVIIAVETLIIASVLVCLGIIAAMSHRFSDWTRGAAVYSAIFGLIELVRSLMDFKAFVEFDETGIRISRRRRWYDLRWDDVRRIELGKVKAAPIYKYLILHTSREKIILEYKFQNREEMWRQIIRYYQQNAKIPLVDDDIPYR